MREKKNRKQTKKQNRTEMKILIATKCRYKQIQWKLFHFDLDEDIFAGVPEENTGINSCFKRHASEESLYKKVK